VFETISLSDVLQTARLTHRGSLALVQVGLGAGHDLDSVESSLFPPGRRTADASAALDAVRAARDVVDRTAAGPAADDAAADLQAKQEAYDAIVAARGDGVDELVSCAGRVEIIADALYGRRHEYSQTRRRSCRDLPNTGCPPSSNQHQPSWLDSARGNDHRRLRA